MKKAVIFDLFGTLVDVGGSPLKDTFKIMRVRMPFGEFVEKFENSVFTQEFEDQSILIRQAFKDFDIFPKTWVVEKIIGVWNRGKLLSKKYEDVDETLKMLQEKGIKVAIISNTQQFSVDNFDKFSFDIDKILFSFKEGKLKTGLLKQVMEELGVSADETLMVGDSIPTDMKAAEENNVEGVLVDRRDRREYEKKIVTLQEIEKYLGE